MGIPRNLLLALCALGILVALCWLGLPAWAVMFGAALRAASFSSLVLGAIPESYAMGGPAVTLLLAWLAWWASQERPVSRAGHLAWGALVGLATGLTVTLIGSAGIVLAIASLRRLGGARAFGRAIALATPVLAGVLLVGAAAARLHGAPAILRPPEGSRSLERFISLRPSDVVAKSLHFGTDFLQATASIGLRRVPPIWGNPGADGLLLPTIDQWSIAGAATIAVLLAFSCWGVAVGLARGATPALRGFSAACLLLIALNLLLHSLYGGHPFLYSEHWLSPRTFFLTLGFLRLGDRTAPAVRPMLAPGVVLALLASNAVWVGRTASAAHAIVVDFGHRADAP